VASVYALAGFMTDGAHVSSSGTANALTEISNAFATVANLENVATGAAADDDSRGQWNMVLALRMRNPRYADSFS